VQKKLNPADNYELPNQVTNIQKQMDIDIKTQLLEFKLKIDEKTACGMLTSHAINKFLESEAEWYKKLSN
jgi:hypothetical protein